MNVVTTLTAACRAIIPHGSDEPIAPRTAAHHQPTRHQAADLLLVIGTMAMALGLVTVVASLASLPGEHDSVTQERPPMVVARVDAPSPRASRDDSIGPPAMPRHLAGAPAAGALAHVGATGPWASPLYPQNSVTLWDRIRVSPPRDTRAFLLGTAIQIHTPQTAATPGPRTD